ncbi:t-SNARE [Periconia macrospinosa]|uniref:t-SNARE n=1 Tax=Periconia macrospinosa TaxID=97972 RepID=A0A2V1DH81_9PLEO|nr:t-SNARE [Periconia macrospinosa]
MSYQQYGGNPYGQEEATTGGYGQSTPYGQTGAHATAVPNNPYAYSSSELQNAQHDGLQPPPAQLAQQNSNYSEVSNYSQNAVPPPPQHQSQPLSQADFLSRRDGAMQRINQLSSSIQEIANIHQRMLSSPDTSSSAQLEGIVTDTQVRNTQIMDEIKFLEKDASREPSSSFKRTQVDSLKRTFETQLKDFRREEADYSKRYREAIARQYLIVNPEATQAEVDEATNTDWGNEGIFQQALKTNRSAQGASVLGAVRARHNDIQRIEKTLGEIALLFQQLNEQVIYDEPKVEQAERQTEQVKDDAGKTNQALTEGIKSARRARKLKWWTLFVVLLIIAILALILGLYFGLRNRSNGP